MHTIIEEKRKCQKILAFLNPAEILRRGFVVWVLLSASERKHTIRDPLRRLSNTLWNLLPCAPFGPIMVGRDKGLEKHLGINNRYYILVIPTVLSSKQLMLKPRAATFSLMTTDCASFFSSFRLLNGESDRVGLIVLLLLHTDCRWRQWDSKAEAALRHSAGTRQLGYMVFWDVYNAPADLQRASTHNWDGWDERKTWSEKEYGWIWWLVLELGFRSDATEVRSFSAYWLFQW